MTNSNQTVASASNASRTTVQILREIEATKDQLAASLVESKAQYAPPTGKWSNGPSGWMDRHNFLAGEGRRRNERRALRRKIDQLRAEWDMVALESSRSKFHPVCQKHQEIIASALCQFTVDAKVDGIFSHNNTHAARKVLRELAAAGYKIVKARS